MVDVIWREDDGLHSDALQIYNDFFNLLEKAESQEELNQIYIMLSKTLSEAYEELFKSFS